MGSKLSINIETPVFKPQDWQYLPEEQDIPEEYGIYRTLRNKQSGQKIDQYQFIWGNQQQFIYYLKSYNWRSRQQNIVNSKFILQKNREEICSYSYMACVYIEHIKLRLSQINDIPYPDNLYMLMESLEGYSKIYDHSKYFIVEENQVCVDQSGNVKVWVNGDLSINYPNVIMGENQKMGKEDMVEAIINMIADNTDYQTEPRPSFREYYFQKKKGSKGKNFDQARNLVFSYARLNNIEIPSRFEAIFNLTVDDIDIKTFTQQSQIQKGSQIYLHQNQLSRQFPSNTFIPPQQRPLYQQSLSSKEPVMTNTIYTSTNPTSHMIHIPPSYAHPIQYSFGSKSKQQLLPPQTSEIHLPAQIQSQIYRFGGSQIQSGIPQSIYRNHIRPISQLNNNKMINTIQSVEQCQSNHLNHSQNSTVPINSYPSDNNKESKRLFDMGRNQVSYFIPNKVEKKKTNEQVQNIPTNNFFANVPSCDANSYFIPNKSNQNKVMNQAPSLIQQQNVINQEQKALQNSMNNSNLTSQKQDEFILLDNSNINLLNSNINKKNSSNSDQLAKSLPLSAGYPSFNRKNLSTIDSANKAVLSQIQSNNQKWPSKHSFGQKKPPQKLVNLSQPSNFKDTKKTVAKPLKYFYTLEQQYEIDPMIAADLAKLS